MPPRNGKDGFYHDSDSFAQRYRFPPARSPYADAPGAYRYGRAGGSIVDRLAGLFPRIESNRLRTADDTVFSMLAVPGTTFENLGPFDLLFAIKILARTLETHDFDPAVSDVQMVERMVAFGYVSYPHFTDHSVLFGPTRPNDGDIDRSRHPFAHPLSVDTRDRVDYYLGLMGDGGLWPLLGARATDSEWYYRYLRAVTAYLRRLLPDHAPDAGAVRRAFSREAGVELSEEEAFEVCREFIRCRTQYRRLVACMLVATTIKKYSGAAIASLRDPDRRIP